MNKNFESFIHAAYTNKMEFSNSMESVKLAIKATIKDTSFSGIQYSSLPQKTNRTGWLKGFLSYPWMMICTIIPVLESLD